MEIQKRPRGRPRVNPEDRIDDILKVAFDIFAEKGFGATTMDAVAQTARISKETLYQLFPNKAVLFNSVLERQINLWSSTEFADLPPRKPSSLRDDLIWLIDLMVRAASNEKMQILTRLAREEAFRFPDLANVVYTMSAQRTVGGLSAIIRQHSEQDGVIARAPEDIAWMIVNVTHGWLEARALGRVSSAEIDTKSWIARTIDVFIASRSVW